MEIVKGFRYKSTSIQGEEGHEKSLDSPEWSWHLDVQLPHWVKDGWCISSALDAMGPDSCPTLNWEHKPLKAYLPKTDYSPS